MSDANPLVHRAVRSGGFLIATGALQFVVAMFLVQDRYPGYSLTANYVSDLGGASSPWALVFDGSAIALGVLAILGFLLIWSAFEPGGTRATALTFLIVAGAGAVGVGVFPETTHVLSGRAHDLATAVAFVGTGVGLTLLAFAMRLLERWRFSRPYTLVTGLLVLVACGLFEASIYLGLGPGGMERLVVYPILLWGIVEGVHLGVLPRLAPGLQAVVASGR